MNPADLAQQFDELVTKLTAGILKILNDWANQVATNTAQGLNDMVQPIVGWFRSDSANFVLHTPLDLVDALGASIGLATFEPLLQAVTNTAFILAGIHYAGHQWFGWPGLGESVQRIGVTIILVGVSDRLLDLSLTIIDDLVQGIANAMPTLPVLTDINPIVLVILVCIWLVLLGRLALAAGKRIAWLAVLKVVAPLAIMTMFHHRSAWIAGTWGKLWVGWLIGQILVVMAIALGAALVTVGGFGGYILSCACLMVAHDAVYVFAPKDAGPSINLGAIARR